jgi:hypothetical protein
MNYRASEEILLGTSGEDGSAAEVQVPEVDG